MTYSKQEWMKTQAEMNELFADIPESLDNTVEVLSKVERYSINHDPILPNFPLPEGFNDNNEYLRYLVYEGAKKRWGDSLTAEQTRSEEHTSELQSLRHRVCRLLLEKNGVPVSFL